MASGYGSIFSFANNKARQAAAQPDDNYGMPSNWVPIDSAPIDPNKPVAYQTPAASGDPYGSGPLPQNFGYQPALVKTGYGGTSAPIPLMPIQGSGVAQANSTSQATIHKIATTAAAEAVANISSTNFTAGNGITISGSVIELTNPIVDGDPIWEIDSAYVLLRDDFNVNRSQDVSVGEIGDLAWNLGGTTGTIQYNWSNTPPHLGAIAWLNGASASNSGCLWGPGAGSDSTGYINSFSLLSSPGWKYVHVFQFAPKGTSSQVAASFADKSFYLGLTGDLSDTDISTSASRPRIFIGLRYDTDTSSPSIGDTTFNFEVVENVLVGAYSRNNTQGTVVNTNITPTAGVWYRLEILCVSAGSVTLSIWGSDGSFSSSSFTVSQYSLTVGSNVASIANGNGIAELSLSSTFHPWNSGAPITISGLTGTPAILNGAALINLPNLSSTVLNWINTKGNITDQNVSTVTVVGYPCLVPCIRWGNSSTGSPASNTYFVYDFFGFVWNSPGLASPSVSVAQTNPRWVSGS